MTTLGPVHVFVLIDALGWALVDGRDFLVDLLPYRQPLRTVLGYSSGAIPTILTGRSPAEHGHWNLFYHDPERSPFRWMRHVGFLPDTLLGHRVTRKLLKELGRRVLGLGPLFDCAVPPRVLPWFDWVEKRNIYAPAGIIGSPSIFDQLAAGGVPHRVYSYHHYSDAQILHEASRDLEAGRARFFFLYLSELDGFLHHHRHDDRACGDRLGWYAAGLRDLFETARRREAESHFTVLSDHGMTPVIRHYDLAREIEALGFAMPRHYLAVYDSTMARFWFFSDAARRAVMARLEPLPCGRIVPDEELRSLGVLFADRRYGEVVFLLHPGWLVSDSGFNGRGWQPEGMHGYHPDDPQSDGVFLSNRVPTEPLRSIADVYEHMCDAAGIVVSMR